MVQEPRFNCALDAAMSVIEGRWKPTIICLLAQNGSMRFNELLNRIGEVSSRMLSKQLKELEADAIVSRTVDDTGALKVSYSLTERGMSLIPILSDLARWGAENQFRTLVEIETGEPLARGNIGVSEPI
jgi:DNA-binding HxlR family transcriptional regulator